MGLNAFLGSKRVKQLNALSMLAQAAWQFWRGNTRLAALYIAGAAISYWNSAAGFVIQLGLRLIRRTGWLAG